MNSGALTIDADGTERMLYLGSAPDPDLFASTAAGELLLATAVPVDRTLRWAAAFGPVGGPLVPTSLPLDQLLDVGPLNADLRALAVGVANGRFAEARFHP